MANLNFAYKPKYPSEDSILFGTSSFFHAPNGDSWRNRLEEDSDIPGLHYLQAAVKETLRLHPPAPVITRLSREDCKFGGFNVPKETLAVVNAHSVTSSILRGSCWPHPRKGQVLNFWSLGGGRRKCPGVNLAFSLINPTVAAMEAWWSWICGKGLHGSSTSMSSYGSFQPINTPVKYN